MFLAFHYAFMRANALAYVFGVEVVVSAQFQGLPQHRTPGKMHKLYSCFFLRQLYLVNKLSTIISKFPLQQIIL